MLNVPTHIGVILDGNRRFARELMKKPWEGHRMGLEKAREMLKWSCEAGIKYLTAYVLSFENLGTRPRTELKYILKFLEMEADRILQDSTHVVHNFQVKVRFIGRLHLLPAHLQAKLAAVEEKTKHYNRHFLNVALAYGGQQEIVDAARRILEKGLKGIIKPAEMDEQIMKQHLYTNGQPYPDLIVRSGGEKRLSNFLSFQSAYSELIFTDKRWPEITRRDFNRFLEQFRSRKRRFGG